MTMKIERLSRGGNGALERITLTEPAVTNMMVPPAADEAPAFSLNISIAREAAAGLTRVVPIVQIIIGTATVAIES